MGRSVILLGPQTCLHALPNAVSWRHSCVTLCQVWLAMDLTTWDFLVYILQLWCTDSWQSKHLFISGYTLRLCTQLGHVFFVVCGSAPGLTNVCSKSYKGDTPDQMSAAAGTANHFRQQDCCRPATSPDLPSATFTSLSFLQKECKYAAWAPGILVCVSALSRHVQDWRQRPTAAALCTSSILAGFGNHVRQAKHYAQANHHKKRDQTLSSEIRLSLNDLVDWALKTTEGIFLMRIAATGSYSSNAAGSKSKGLRLTSSLVLFVSFDGVCIKQGTIFDGARSWQKKVVQCSASRNFQSAENIPNLLLHWSPLLAPFETQLCTVPPSHLLLREGWLHRGKMILQWPNWNQITIIRATAFWSRH